MKKVSIITVNFNQPLATLELLRSIEANNGYSNIEIIVVDNGSVIENSAEISGEFPGLTYIRSEENLGFAGGNNLGIKKATGDYIFFVNNDTEFTSELVELLTQVFADKPAAGIVCPKIMYYSHHQIIQYVGFTEMNFYTGRNKCIGQFETDDGQFNISPYKTAFPHGAAMMVRKDAIAKAGFMPETYFLYYEEMDWSEKIKESGYEVWIQPKAIIYHKESLSVGANSALKEYYMTRNRILFIRRNATAFQRLIFYFYFTTIVIPKSLLHYIFRGELSLLRPFFRAIRWNLNNRPKLFDT